MRNSDRSFVCAIRGPVMLIAVGGLFALAQSTSYGVHQTWPILLILLGLLKLLERVGGGGQPSAPNPPAGVSP
jgi:hypothetical protein